MELETVLRSIEKYPNTTWSQSKGSENRDYFRILQDLLLHQSESIEPVFTPELRKIKRMGVGF